MSSGSGVVQLPVASPVTTESKRGKSKSKLKTFRFVCLGNAGVGKTALICRYAKGVYNESYQSTIGMDIVVKRVWHQDSKSEVELDIWDCAGQERFHSLAPSYYRQSHALILAFDVTDHDSFVAIDKWYAAVSEDSKDAKRPIVLVACKCDVKEEKRNVTQEQIDKKCAELGLDSCYKTSALDNTGIEVVFLSLLNSMYELTPHLFANTIVDSENVTKADLTINPNVNLTRPTSFCCS